MIIPNQNIKSKQLDSLINLKNQLKFRNYSPKTCKAYIDINLKFLEWTRKSPREVTNNDIKRYLESRRHGGAGASTLSVNLNALKFYYQKVLKRKFFVDIQHPKKALTLPVVLGLGEVSLLLNSIDNQKHRLALSLMYGSGLRVAEVVKLKVGDLDFERKTIHVKSGKGNKDRITILSPKLAEELKIFLNNKQVKDYVIGGRNDKMLTTRSIQKVFVKALEKAKIKKAATCHSLRHSFATHLLENGTNIRYIQKLLGHKKLETTQIYTQVTNKALQGLVSPLDLI
ncbi:tyrosine-type recombinase/integrase [Candidatus Kuenenbacteria bacterium]|nr:tyrosine-type recombinase/integrase [Candidatus Kuenenbacteria bacterium]